jgi:hypothetical protein
VKAAVERGELPVERLSSFQRLHRELRHLDAKVDQHTATEEKRRAKVIHKGMRRITSKRI